MSLSAADLQQVWPGLLRVEARAAPDEPPREGSALRWPSGSCDSFVATGSSSGHDFSPCTGQSQPHRTVDWGLLAHALAFQLSGTLPPKGYPIRTLCLGHHRCTISSLTGPPSIRSSFPISDEYISFSDTTVCLKSPECIVASCIAQLPATGSTPFPPLMGRGELLTPRRSSLKS